MNRIPSLLRIATTAVLALASLPVLAMEPFTANYQPATWACRPTA